MGPLLKITAMTGAALLGLGGAVAHAQQVPGAVILAANDFAATDFPSHDLGQRRSLEWDSKKGRWGLRLDVERHLNGGVQIQDVQPGVYYRLSRRLNIGGAVSLAPAGDVGSSLIDPQAPTPRVRLETTFKF